MCLSRLKCFMSHTTDTGFCWKRSRYKRPLKDAVEEWRKFLVPCFTTKPGELFFTLTHFNKYLYTHIYHFIIILEVPTNSKSSLFLLLLLPIDKVPYILVVPVWNASIFISECHVFGKADNQTDCTGPQHHRLMLERIQKRTEKNSFHIPAYRRCAEI